MPAASRLIGTLWRSVGARKASVESRLGAGADAERRPVSHTRSSNRTCGFPASGFPTGFIVNSRTRAHRPLQTYHAQGTKHLFLRELAGTLRRHLVAPSQKMPYLLLHIPVFRPVCLGRCPKVEVPSPASDNLIQPLAHFFPWFYVSRHQHLPHFLLDPGHALLRRT